MSGGTNCIICFEQFQESPSTTPVMLSCGHSFCRSCLSNMTTPILCPICRVQHSGPHPAQLPTNYGLLSLASIIVGKLKDGIHGTLSTLSSPVATPYGTPTETSPLIAHHQFLPVINSTLQTHATDSISTIRGTDTFYFSLQSPTILNQTQDESPEQDFRQVNHGEQQVISNSLIFSIFADVTLSMYFTIMVIVGSLYIHQSPAEPSLPVWLIVEGVLGLILLIQTANFFSNDKSKCRTVFFILHLQYHVIILIIATFKIYGVGGNSNIQLYKFLFGIISTFYVLVASSFIIIVCLYLCNVYTRDNTVVPRWAIFLMSVLFALFLAMTITGLMSSDKCPYYHHAALWLILQGIGGIIVLIQFVELAINQGNKCRYSLLVVNVTINIIWFIVGSIWIYDSSTICDYITYLIAFWIITFGCVLIALSLLTGGLVLYIKYIPTELSPGLAPWKLLGVTIVLSTVSISMAWIGIGSEHDANCSDFPRVKTWLILQGTFGTILAMVYLDSRTHYYSDFRSFLFKVNAAICVILFMFGTAWVLGPHRLCNSLPYNYAFYVIIISYIFLGLFIMYKLFAKCCSSEQ